ncbi:hypothetical protein [Desulfosarcina ovata]|uniref:Uncharacterized protein n=1 Tax=Desulfosarcina ovata subsp. ovata TaxID=2752305 RepID=A0A5K8AK21_9BACT|nr:hypothetical protein [Desulfosarcina ovata]BBO92849.1 hypothetical protein DSCOOX_60290 [Desulfosarcina ovata subsp. ovata]
MMGIMMCKRNIQLGRTIIAGALALSMLYGCTTTSTSVKRINAGDAVLVDYTCRIENGDILASTQEQIVFEKEAQVSHAFVPMKSYGSIPLMVNREMKKTGKPITRGLQEEISYRLGKQLIGQAYDQILHLAVASEAIENLPKMERYLQIAKIIRRPKQRDMPKADFIKVAGKEPKVGEILFEDRSLQWRVMDVQKDSVTIRYLAEEGQRITLPSFGEAIVREKDDHYNLEIQGRPGSLIRVGPYIGRIVDITNKLFIIDFEHPFGGRELSCEVTVKKENDHAALDLESDSKKE